MMPQQKIIEKKALEQVRLSVIKYYNVHGPEEIENMVYEDWQNACEKAFPVNYEHAPHKYNMLKDLSRDLRKEPFETWCKVYEALGYEIK